MPGPSRTGLTFSRTKADEKPKRRNGTKPYGVDPQVLRMLSVGRTVPWLAPMADPEDIEGLADKLGYERHHDWDRTPAAQKLDLLATHLINKSRTKSTQSAYVLSVWQWYQRSYVREIPMNHEQLQAVVNHVPWARVYRGSMKPSYEGEINKHLERLDANDEKAQNIEFNLLDPT